MRHEGGILYSRGSLTELAKVVALEVVCAVDHTGNAARREASQVAGSLH